MEGMGRPSKNMPPAGSTSLLCNKCNEVLPPDHFYWKADGTPQALICKGCWRMYHAKRGGYQHQRAITCERCGATKEVMKVVAQYCSRACKDRARRDEQIAARLAEKATHPVRTCPVCSTALTHSHRTDAVFCSISCSDRAHTVTRKIAKRAGKTGRGDGPLISLAFIGDRDNWHCGICGGSVDKQKRHPDPLAASIDHIVPVSRGGGDDLTNLQLSHFRCNWKKGGRA